LNVACSAACEIAHRQGEQFSTQKIENRGIESHSRKRQQIFLSKRRELDENNYCKHAEQDCLQKADIVFDNHLVHDHLREHGKEEFQKTHGNSQPQHLEQNHFKARQKGKYPSQCWLALRSLFECWCVIEQRRVAGPFPFEFTAWKFPQATRWIGHTHELLIDIVEHDPMIAFPMHYRRQRHHREIAQRDF
jgi:hypothetical protein